MTIHTTDLHYAGLLIALGLAKLHGTLPPHDSERFYTFELSIAEENLERARDLEREYGDIDLPTSPPITISRFLDGAQRMRRAMAALRNARSATGDGR